MSTAMHSHTGPVASPPAQQPQNDQLRRDRRTAVIVVAVMVALMALVIWLASLGGGVEYDSIDYWHMMP